MNDVFTLATNSVKLKYGIPRNGMVEIRNIFRGAGNVWEIDNASRRLKRKTISKVLGVDATATKILRDITGIYGIW